MSKEILIRAAIESMGGYSATARKVSTPDNTVTYQAVQSWIKQGNIPPKHVMTISQESGIAPHALSPEVFKKQKTPSEI